MLRILHVMPAFVLDGGYLSAIYHYDVLTPKKEIDQTPLKLKNFSHLIVVTGTGTINDYW